MNIDPDFSSDSFLKFLQTLDVNKQKRMLFMIEAELHLFQDLEYNTDFGLYPDYQNWGFDKRIRTPFYKNYLKLFFSLSENFLVEPDDEMKSKWEEIKTELLEGLKLNQEIFGVEYDCFKMGLKLKALRLCSKREFVEKSGLSIGKIGQIEDFGFLAKIKDVSQYVEQGLKRKLNINFDLKQK